jgi:UDP-glucose:(heptosyl)LPS alpha-1,3-glucosyltransferase
LEAIVNGLPAVVTGLCGFAEHVARSGAGIVLPEPFTQADLDAALVRLRDAAVADTMSRAGIDYGQQTAPVSGLEQAADIIEEPSARRRTAGQPASPPTKT